MLQRHPVSQPRAGDSLYPDLNAKDLALQDVQKQTPKQATDERPHLLGVCLQVAGSQSRRQDLRSCAFEAEAGLAWPLQAPPAT